MSSTVAWVLVEFTAYYATGALQVVDRTAAVSACNSSSAIDAQIVACLVADAKAALGVFPDSEARRALLAVADYIVRRES